MKWVFPVEERRNYATMSMQMVEETKERIFVGVFCGSLEVHGQELKP